MNKLRALSAIGSLRLLSIWSGLKYFLGWWLWRRWRIYYPRAAPMMESRKSVVARLNKRSWPCSDEPLFFPAMEMQGDQDAE